MNDDTLSRDEREMGDDEPSIPIDEILQRSLIVPNGDQEMEEAVSALETAWQQTLEEAQWAAEDALIESIIPDDQLPDFHHYQEMRNSGDFRGNYGDWQNFEAPRQGPKDLGWGDRVLQQQANAGTQRNR